MFVELEPTSMEKSATWFALISDGPVTLISTGDDAILTLKSFSLLKIALEPETLYSTVTFIIFSVHNIFYLMPF